jgi:16S rRNA (adenine1518-N6/adenine1519-N6)-dimethyltransferase
LSRVTASEIRTELEALEVRPSRRLGQNFLADANIAAAIVAQLGLGAGDSVVEIGAGLGALSEHLAGRVRRLTLVEADRRLAGWLRERFGGDPSVEVVEADAATLDLRRFFAGRPVKVVGNLPYSAGGAILKNTLGNPSPFDRAVFMLQKEVCDRLCAAPRSKDYGALSLRVQSRWVPQTRRLVPPDVFWPRPEVGSAVVVLDPRDRRSLPAFDDALFDRLVRHGFAQRRKQLKKLLPPRPGGAAWTGSAAALGVPETARAEELSLAHWVALTNLYDGGSAGGAAGQHGGEVFDVVDADDAVTGRATRAEVHAQGFRHRAVHLLIFNRQGELFLQKRSHLKDVHPGLWDSSAAGHLDAGEDYEAAAGRELREELGIDAELSEAGRIAACEGTGWEFVRVYTGTVEKPRDIRYPPAEIETGAFFPLATVRTWTARRPEDFASGFLASFRAAGLAEG